jgi:hypothetical protein
MDTHLYSLKIQQKAMGKFKNDDSTRNYSKHPFKFNIVYWINKYNYLEN